jgi:hypothetical protein
MDFSVLEEYWSLCMDLLGDMLDSSEGWLRLGLELIFIILVSVSVSPFIFLSIFMSRFTSDKNYPSTSPFLSLSSTSIP